MTDTTVGYAICGSFCTFSKTIQQIKKLVMLGAKVLPIMSQNAYSTDTRFYKAADFRTDMETITGSTVIDTIPAAERNIQNRDVL